MANDLPEIGLLHRIIGTTRRLLRATWTATGLGMTIGLGLVLLVAVSLADLAVAFREWLRLVGLLLVAVPSVLAFVNGVLRPLFRRMTERFVARRIEATLPGIHNRLVSCVDLHAEKRDRFSAAFLRRLIGEAIERVKNFRPWSVVDQSSLRRAGLFALIGIAVFATALGVFSDRLPTALARIFSPFADIPPATGVTFEVQPGTIKMLRGDPVEFVASVTKGQVERLRLELVPIDGEQSSKTLWHELRPDADGGKWTLRLPSYEHSFQYRVHGGGTWTKLATVTMLERPRLVGLQAIVNYPSYMQMPEPRVNPPDVADVSGPIASTVSVSVKVEGDASIGEIQLLREEIRSVPIMDRPERIWVSDALPKGHAVEGNWEWRKQPDPQNPLPTDAIAGPADGIKWHSHPAANGLSYHLFHSAAVPFEVHSGDVLFAEVFVMSAELPEELMLQFHDGQNWERRAFWGSDKIDSGTIDTPSRLQMGELPAAGKWARLEVPARELDLEGRTIRGVNFTQFSGKALWGRVGTMPPPARDVREFVVDRTFPLARVSEPEDAQSPSKTKNRKSRTAGHFAAMRKAETWAGTFPIERDGWYRVELKNEIGAANQQMKEARIVSVPDNPPQIMIERPGIDLVLSEPVKVPVVIATFDDFGLGELVVSTQRGDGAFQGRPIKSYSGTQRADTAIVTLDLIDLKLQSGDTLKYRAEIRDRNPNGQSAQTPDFTIRIVSSDPNAADKKLAQLEQQEDTFREKLVKLIAEQKAVQEKLNQLEEKNKPLTEKVEATQAEAEKAAEQAATEAAAKDPAAKDANKPKDSKLPEAAPPELKLDPEAQKMLNELKQELAQLQKPEQQNAATAEQLQEQLKNLAKEAGNQQLIPPELQREMAALSEAFQQAATNPIKELAAEIQKSAQPKAQDPKLPQLQARGDQVQQNLEALKDRLDAIREAQKDARQDAAKALAELQRAMTKQRGELTERELAELRAAIEALRQELQNLANTQSQLAEVTPEAPEMLVGDLEKKQKDIDRKTDKELAKTKELQQSDEYKKLKQQRNPKFPNRPYDPETGAALMPPNEDDTPPTDEEMAAKANGENPPGENKPKGDKDDPDADLFMPALGGPKPKLDPRFKDKQRPVAKKSSKDSHAKSDKSQPADPNSDAEQRRADLADQQAKQLDRLNKADQSLAADQQTLDALLGQLEKALQQARAKGKPQSAQPSDQANDSPTEPGEGDMGEPQLSPEMAAELAELLQSETAQKAMQMAARMQAMKAGNNPQQPGKGPKPPSNQPPPPSTTPLPTGNLDGDAGTQFAMEAALKELDPSSRAVILKMQPRMREELLQGLREEGPDGYQRFIRDYFERLTKAGQNSKEK